MVDSVVVVGMLIHDALLHSVCDLKAAKINMQHSLISELILYKFKLGHNTTETTKNFCGIKSEGTIDNSITR